MEVVKLLLKMLIALLRQLLVVHTVVNGGQSLVASRPLAVDAVDALLEFFDRSLIIAHTVAQLVLGVLLVGIDLLIVVVLLLQVLLLLLMDSLQPREGLVQAWKLYIIAGRVENLV